ncbi:hypothetical protein RIF23_15530 [Lipingzhangella sp. LS1_29]|uniref:Uncharacterized protein n=1 Tax=Lipingzhangella rawalii TaxID=2055835 RepID=A0ABU2H8S5_9ACTN|nr:hypothetical protein [Lipingzhangella rawalii]MDS1271706.1 hypothetical protein [Lipingzhangella rawalii]
MQGNDSLDLSSVYQPEEPHDQPRAFYVDCWDEDLDDVVHRYYGVTNPVRGGGIAQPLTGSGMHSFADVRQLAARLGGEVAWL